MINLNIVPQAIKKIYDDERYVLLSSVAAAIIFSIFIFLPAGRMSAKIFYYQVTSLDFASLLVMATFAVILGIMLSMNVYLFKKTHESKSGRAGKGIMSMLSSFVAGIFGSSICVACLSLLLGFIGLPAVTLLIAYRVPIFIVSAAIALSSHYLSSKAIVEHDTCKVCKVSARSGKRVFK